MTYTINRCTQKCRYILGLLDNDIDKINNTDKKQCIITVFICIDIKEDIKAEKGRKRVSDDNRDMYEMYQELYHMLHLAQNFGFAPFF